MTAPTQPPESGFRLVRYFTLASLAALVLVAAALLYFEHRQVGVVQQRQQEQHAFFAQTQDDMMERHDAAAPAYLLRVYEEGTVNLTRLLANAMWEQDFAPFVAKAQRIPVDQCRAIADVKDAGGKTVPPGEKQACFAEVGKQIRALPEFKALDARVFDAMRKSTVFKIKVYDLRGITVYSSEHRQIGEDKLGNAGWQNAAAGKPASALTHRDKLSAFEGVIENRDLIESYLPIRTSGSDEIAGVFEVYSDVKQFLDEIKRTSSEIQALNAANHAQLTRAAAANLEKVDETKKQQYAIVLSLFALLYLALFIIARNGQHIIDKQDIARKQATAALSRQKDLYDALSQSNKAIVHLVDRDELFAAVCRIAVEHGRFRFAWIGLVDENDQRLKPVARYGEDAGYIDALDASGGGGSDLSRGLTGRALFSGAYVVSNDFLNDPEMAPWHEAARRAGVRASAKFAIRQAGAAIGAINLYAGEAGFFTDDLLSTLDEMANDVSFALDNYAREAALKEAGEALRASEERFRTIFDSAVDGILVAHAETRQFLFGNLEICRMLGYTIEEIVRLRVQDIHPQQDLPRVMAEFERQLRGETSIATNSPVRRKDGSVFYADIKTSPIRLGGTDGLLSVFRDATERKRAEEALREGEKRYRQMFEENPHPMWVYDAETLAFLAVNDAAVAHYGWSREEFLAMTIADIRPAAALPALHDFIAQKAADVIRRGVWQHRKKDGTLIDVEIGSHVMDFGGRRARIVSAHDITVRKQAEDALRAAAEQFRGLVEQSIAGTYIVQDGVFAYVNPRFAEIFGYASADELIGRDPLLIVAEKDHSAVAENIRRRFEGEARSISYGFTGVRKDGATLDVGAHGAAATYRSRPAIIGLIQDISEKKRAEEQIQHYVAQLEKAFMSTVQVATTLSEMRDPYTAGHERRVAEIAVAIAAELGFDARRQEGLRVACYLHDIGKISVPSEILSKPGRLNPAEFALIRGHAQASYDILKNVEFPWPVADFALQHHERMDGSGYPQGLKGEAILLEARILAVADVVEAMSSHRPYRPGLGLDKALAEIERGRGTLFDASVADTCLRLFREKGYTIPS